MAGRLPLLTDENIPGPLIDGLRTRGWDVLRVVDVLGQRSVDEVVFLHAAEAGRVLVSTDTDCLTIARQWLETDRAFRLIYWHQGRHQRGPVAPFIDAFEALAQKGEAFAAGIEYLTLDR